MTANQLRIGNLISISKGFHNDDIRYVDLKMLEAINNGFEMFGIPLSWETLEKVGFELSQDGFYYFGDDATFRIHDNMMLIDMAYTDPTDDSVFYMNIGDVQYIHELQNLIFALTGEEPNIEL